MIETSDGQPVLAARRYGQGRVAILLSNTLWTWQLGGTDGLGKGLYGRFITQLIHWLNPGGHDAEDSETLQIVIASGEVDLHNPWQSGIWRQGEIRLRLAVTTPSGETLTIPMRQATWGASGTETAQDGSCAVDPSRRHIPIVRKQGRCNRHKPCFWSRNQSTN